jgi:cytoskeletal protein RodZ
MVNKIKTMNTRKPQTRKKIVLLGILALVILLIAGGLIRYQFTNKDSSQTGNDAAKTTSTVKSAQSDFTSDDTTKTTDNTLQKDSSSGVITDTNGASASAGNSSTSTSSSNGEIVVFAPAKNSLLVNGATISGTSSLSKVSYRIVDTEVGVVSTGTLNVVNGKFSGTLQFQTNASTGQLDFFGTQSDGNEFDNISIPVRFK